MYYKVHVEYFSESDPTYLNSASIKKPVKIALAISVAVFGRKRGFVPFVYL